MRYIILALIVAGFAMSCSKGDAGGTGLGSDSLKALTYLDLSYGEDAKQKMDVYLPEKRNVNTRLVIIIHGGGWTGGDKSDFTGYITEFQKRLPGYAFANINYRLVTQTDNYFPAQENDVKSAVKFLLDQSGDYVISKDFIFIGISAGAHLSLLQAYKHSDVVQPKGVVSYFGPTDLEQLYINSGSSIPFVLNNITNSTLDILSESSPINYVSSNSAPTLLLHGDADQLVPLEQATLLENKLQQAGVKHELVVYPGQGHDLWTNEALQDSFQRIEVFIKGL